jgi:BirA family transcriptional regulator, biotin operon repressor / biotin---[acetyl-CoA-carboxylase] ligase
VPSDATDGSAYADLERPPLAVAPLRRALLRPGSGWTSVTVVRQTGSTNADLVRMAASGECDPGAVLVAESQTSGRGRLAREWVSPPRAGLTFSALVAPGVPVQRWGWLPLLVGMAVRDGLLAASELATRLKWPNDVLVGELKLAGVLCERVDVAAGPLAVIGVGLNVTTTPAELSGLAATSVAEAGGEPTDRQSILVAVLRALHRRILDFASGADPAPDYRAACSTLGRDVRIDQPSGRSLSGLAESIDDDARLVVVSSEGVPTTVTAGDVIHVR